MLSVYFSVLLVVFAVCVGFGLPWLSVHLGELRERENAHVIELHRQRQVIADYEARIRAFGEFVIDDPELSLTAR